MPAKPKTQNLNLQQIEQLCRNALAANGARGDQLAIATQSVVDAERDGIRAVGLNYLPVYCGHLQHNKLRGDAVAEHRQLAPAVLQSDAAHGFAHAAFVEVEQDFCRLSHQQGIAALSIINSYSAGVVGWFVERLAKQGLIGIGLANSPAAVAPTRGAPAFFGTNPLAFAIPRAAAAPLLADMATSQVALVTIKQYAAEGKPIPLGWGYDAHGQLTEDASAVVNGGTLAPLGGYKGVLLALLVDVLAGALAGPNCSFNAPAFRNNVGSYPAVGQCFLAIAPTQFTAPGTEDQFATRVETMLTALLQLPEVRLPGDRRHAHRRQAEQHGVEVPQDLLDKLQELGGSFNETLC